MPARTPNLVISVIDGEVIVDVSSSKFPNCVTRVDETDLPLIVGSPRRWYVAKTKNGLPYAARNMGAKTNQRTELLHRVILGLVKPEDLGDHRDHDTLNNRRYNLRLASFGQNLQNQRGHRNSSSAYLGVSWCKRDQCWRAHCQIDKKHRALGSYKTEEQAALAYDDAVRHDPFANLNFPENVSTSKIRQPLLNLGSI